MNNRAKLVLFLMALVFLAAFVSVYSKPESNIRQDTERNMTASPSYTVVSNDG